MIWVGERDGLYKLERRNKGVIALIEFNSEVTYMVIYEDDEGGTWLGK